MPDIYILWIFRCSCIYAMFVILSILYRSSYRVASLSRFYQTITEIITIGVYSKDCAWIKKNIFVLKDGQIDQKCWEKFKRQLRAG